MHDLCRTQGGSRSGCSSPCQWSALSSCSSPLPSPLRADPGASTSCHESSSHVPRHIPLSVPHEWNDRMPFKPITTASPTSTSPHPYSVHPLPLQGLPVPNPGRHPRRLPFHRLEFWLHAPLQAHAGLLGRLTRGGDTQDQEAERESGSTHSASLPRGRPPMCSCPSLSIARPLSQYLIVLIPSSLVTLVSF